MSCNICAYNYNKSTHTCVACPYCSFEVCRTCCETYILSEPTPRCMNSDCYKEWSRQFLRDNFTLVFLTKRYRPHMENVLFDKEKALLPDAQLVIEEKNRKKEVREKIKEVESDIRVLEVKRFLLEQELQGNSKKERVEFVRECPADGCRGFLSSQWKCGICQLWTCPDCHELKGPSRECDHICNPNNVETARLLEKDSKPCPSCHSLIFRISGCNQMFCTRCNTAFCWVTGKINKTQIHNPHYFEWLRNNGVTPGEEAARHEDPNNCDRELNTHDALRLINSRNRHSRLAVCRSQYLYTPSYTLTVTSRSNTNRQQNIDIDTKGISTIEWFELIIRNAIHLVQVDMPSFPVSDYVNENIHIRVAYLEGLMSEVSFKTEIQRRDKKNRKNIEINQIIQFIGTAVKDIIFRLIEHLNNSPENQYDLEPFVLEVEGLVLQANDLFTEVSHTYNSVRYRLDDDLSRRRVERTSGKKQIHGGGGGGIIIHEPEEDNSDDDS